MYWDDATLLTVSNFVQEVLDRFGRPIRLCRDLTKPQYALSYRCLRHSKEESNLRIHTICDDIATSDLWGLGVCGPKAV